MSDVSALPPAIRAYVRDFVQRGRKLALSRGTGWAVATLLAWMLAWCVGDRFLQFPSAARAAALITGVVLAFLCIARPLLQYVRRDTDWVRVAERIERQNPRFGQRLVTIISRLMGRPEHRGSDEILEHLVYELDRQVVDERGDALVPLRPVIHAWVAASLVLAVGIGLVFVADLGMPKLALRFVAPMANVPPVTTTRLHVMPGNRDVAQSAPLQIDVDVDRLSDGQVWLHTSQDNGRNWSRTAMNPSTADGRFSFALSAVDRDLLYYVAGGDATSPRYQVRVLRKPAVTEFQVRYIYPAYTGKPSLVVTNIDGRVEAPAGTDAIITITATEPLQSALLTIGGEKTLMVRGGGGAENQRQARVTVLKDEKYELDLISDRDQTGSGPATTAIHAQTDRPPLVRVLQPANDNLRLNPRDILPIAYEAADDYGLDSIAVRAQVGSAAPTDVPVESFATDARPEGPAAPGEAATGDARAEGTLPRHRQGVFQLDLATLPLSIGDVLTIVVSARDTGGNPAYSEPLHVLVSPRSIDLDTHIRIYELSAADQLCATVIEELDAAAKALNEAHSKGAESQAGAAPLGRMHRWLTGTSEAAALVRRSLVRADARSNAPELSTALAAWVDAAQTISSTTDALFRAGADTQAARQSAAESIQKMQQSVRELQSDLHAVAAGQRAAAILLDRENLVAAEKRPPPKDGKAAEMRTRSIQRMRDEIADGAKLIEVKPFGNDFDAQLKGKADAAKSLVNGKRPIDFASAAREWSQRMQKDALRNGALDDRLGAAAQAEAVRPDSDAAWARDLQLAGRAAYAVQTSARQVVTERGAAGAPPVSAATLNEFAAAMEAMQREHVLRRSTDGPRRPDELAAARTQATKARELLARMAGETDAIAGGAVPQTTASAGLATGAGTGVRHGRTEALALRAGAEASAQNYAKAAELDRALVRHVGRTATTTPASTSGDMATVTPAAAQQQAADLDRAGQALSRTMASAERIDAIGADQDKVVEQTEGAAKIAKPQDAEAAAGQMAAQQRSVAEQISAVGRQQQPNATDDANWRDRASAAVVAAQERLAALPEQLAHLQESAGLQRDAVTRAKSARRDADGAPPDRKPAAERAAKQAADDAAEATAQMEDAARSTAPAVADTLAAALEPFAPDASAARDVANLQLAPAMKKLSDATRANDAGATERAAADVRLAVESAQKELASAQEAFADRDPLIAAKWYARAAADALSRRPPDFDGAQRRQRQTSVALSKAWNLTLHRAAGQRLALVPSMRPVLALVPPAESGPGAASGLAEGSRPAGPTAKDWRRLRQRDGDDLAAIQRDGEPSEYEAALKAYFEALNRARDGAGKTQ